MCICKTTNLDTHNREVMFFCDVEHKRDQGQMIVFT